MSTLLERHGPYVPPLVLGRLADTATTLYGLQIAGAYERNPFVAALIELLGPGSGLLLANLLTIGTVVLAVEVALAVADADAHAIDVPLAERTVLDVGYLPAVALSFTAAVYNVGVIATA